MGGSCLRAKLCEDVVTQFVPMIVDYALCNLSRKFGRWEEAAVFLDRARSVFGNIGREH